MTTIHWNEAALRRELAGPRSGTAMYLSRVGARVESQAKQNASGRPGPRVDTGNLRSSITHALGDDAFGPFVDIGTNVFYGLFLELGTSRMRPYPFLVPALQAVDT